MALARRYSRRSWDRRRPMRLAADAVSGQVGEQQFSVPGTKPRRPRLPGRREMAAGVVGYLDQGRRGGGARPGPKYARPAGGGGDPAEAIRHRAGK